MALSKEEKKAKKEAKRLEKLQAEAEARKKLKREELQREIAAQAKKRGELDKSWREMMLKIKEPVFKQDIEVMWQTFERTFDKKDHVIKYTVKLMDVADDQFQRTVSSFCDTIDTMINKFLSDLEALSTENNFKTKELLKLGVEDASQIAIDHNAAETHLQLLLYHGRTSADSLAWATRGENLVKEDEERIKCANERENLRSYLENTYSVMWDDYKAVLKAYISGTADNQKQVRKLRRKDNLIGDIIAAQAKKIANSGGMLKRLRNELGAYESGTKQAVFRDRRNRHRAACFRLKKTLIDGCATDGKKMHILVKATDDTMEWLEAAHKKGEKILRLAALCRKYETLHEKVLPFGSKMPDLPTQALSHRQSEDSLVVNAISTTCGLTRLWQRISKAELIKRALVHEKRLLEQENIMIMHTLEEYRDRSITAEAQRCVCQQSVKKISDSNPPVAIEGVFEMSKYRNY